MGVKVGAREVLLPVLSISSCEEGKGRTIGNKFLQPGADEVKQTALHSARGVVAPEGGGMVREGEGGQMGQALLAAVAQDIHTRENSSPGKVTQGINGSEGNGSTAVYDQYGSTVALSSTPGS